MFPIPPRDDPFYSSKFSINWAKDHLVNLDNETKIFFDDKSTNATVTERDTTTGYDEIKFKLLKEMPISMEGHTIDTVYNLRAALDQAIFSVATLHGTLHLRGTPSFPFRNSIEDLERDWDGVIGKFVPQEISDVVSPFKPYRGGDDFLWALNKVCGCNKHGFIRPMPMAAGAGNISGTAQGIQIPHPLKWDSLKNEMILIRIPSNAKGNVKYDLSFNIVFDQIEFVEGRPVATTLLHFLSVTESIVLAVEAESRRIGLIK